AIHSPQLRTQLVVDATLVPLAEQEKVSFTESWQKRIGIACRPYLTLIISDYQVVGINPFGRIADPFIESRRVNLFQLDDRLVLLKHRPDLDFRSIGQKCPHYHSGAIPEWMHPQK